MDELYKNLVKLKPKDKATSDELDREALISAVLEPIIPPKRRKATA